jgi:DNA-binding transcriptional ArsR family regulator
MPRPHLASPPAAFAALGDPTRLQVFLLLSREPQSVAEVAPLHVGQPPGGLANT